MSLMGGLTSDYSSVVPEGHHETISEFPQGRARCSCQVRTPYNHPKIDIPANSLHRLMLAYPEVPQWYYLAIGLVSFVLGIITIKVWDTQLPVWAFILAIIIALVYAVPIGMIQAITNVQVGLK